MICISNIRLFWFELPRIHQDRYLYKNKFYQKLDTLLNKYSSLAVAQIYLNFFNSSKDLDRPIVHDIIETRSFENVCFRV